jgi:hypothetical protein
MGVEWIDHNGKRILLIDHRGLEPEAVIKNIELAAAMVGEVPSPARIRYLANFEGATVNAAVMACLKKVGQEVFEPITDKSAVIGVTGIRNILLAAYNRVTGAGSHQKLFDSQEEALDWLVS